MGEWCSRNNNIDVDKLISYSDDLVKVLQDQHDVTNLTHTLKRTVSLSSTCDSDFNHLHSLLQDYQKKIDACKQKTEEARCATTTDAELDLLQRELDEELEKERLLKEEFRAVSNKFIDLEQQWASVQEQKKTSLKIEKDKLRTQMLLSMYASVTNIVPNLDDESKISGYIVEKDKNVVDKFEYDSSKIPTQDVCNDIWNTISS
ncbi:PREDICTED: uncharacterized protein LOC109325197 [Lupinus angustifolius]|uniref:uncharacterized protein LOC109325197 n=1 Tax=Lupinus angustifolius TaxID=3871 RepID=UPI00092FA4E0|nr:PREDICTED: uncharacterized protein LOC109325197 [Lupinus angustifolius]XP_019412941.1 PREDICTED: uncharacterized protein LOC109325197 [Lupinus angustifolius]